MCTPPERVPRRGTLIFMTTPRIGALILGGGQDRLAKRLGFAAKGLVPFQGVPLGQRVLGATRSSAHIVTTTYVGPADWEFLPSEANAPGGDRLVDSLAFGAGAVLANPAQVDWVLLLTADLPWLTGEDIDAFIAECAPAMEAGAQLCYAVAPERVMAQAYPGEKRTYVTLADGKVTGGNLALVHRSFMPKLLPFIDDVFRNRKNPIALARIVGLGTLFALLTKRARISAIEARASTLTGAPLKAVLTDRAAIANDVDAEEHLQ